MGMSLTAEALKLCLMQRSIWSYQVAAGWSRDSTTRRSRPYDVPRVDLGQRVSNTAIVILERLNVLRDYTDMPRGVRERRTHVVRHAETAAFGTPYPEVTGNFICGAITRSADWNQGAQSAAPLSRAPDGHRRTDQLPDGPGLAVLSRRRMPTENDARTASADFLVKDAKVQFDARLVHELTERTG